MTDFEKSTLAKFRENLDRVETRVRVLHFLSICDSVPLYQIYEKNIPNLRASANGFIRANPERSAELALEVTRFLSPDLQHQSPGEQKILFAKHVLGLVLTDEEWVVYSRVNDFMGTLMARNQQRPLRELETEEYEETLSEALTENGFQYHGKMPLNPIIEVVESIAKLTQK